MSADQEAYLAILKVKLHKALTHLEYSYRKVITLSTDVATLNEEELALWESFSARFSRVVDIFLVRYVRVFVKLNDPGFEGSLRDFVNQAEKLGLIDQAQKWMKMRELRNITSHEYTDQNLSYFLDDVRNASSFVLGIKELCD